MKNILVCCEESQEVCKAFRKLGANAYSCDLQPCSGGHPEWHIQSNVLPLINGNCTFMTLDGTFHTITGSWDLLICHPPCTYFCRLGTIALTKHGNIDLERLHKGLQVKNMFLAFLNSNAKHICVENPVPTKIWGLPPYSQRIQPYEFGHFVSKLTCLWLRNLPYLMPTYSPPSHYTPYVYDTQKGFKNNFERSKYRSKTFPGVAQAMAEQWLPII